MSEPTKKLYSGYTLENIDTGYDSVQALIEDGQHKVATGLLAMLEADLVTLTLEKYLAPSEITQYQNPDDPKRRRVALGLYEVHTVPQSILARSRLTALLSLSHLKLIDLTNFTYNPDIPLGTQPFKLVKKTIP